MAEGGKKSTEGGKRGRGAKVQQSKEAKEVKKAHAREAAAKKAKEDAEPKPKEKKQSQPGKKSEPKKPAKEKHEKAGKKTVKEAAEKKEEKKGGKPVKKKDKKPKPKPIEKIKFAGERSLTEKEKSILKSKPRFQRPEARMYKCLSASWRRPQGIDSKQLEGKRGKPAMPSVGYRKPDGVSGLVKGFKAKKVENPSQVAVSDPKTEAIIIAGRVGRRKRNEIIKIANEKKITILNPRKGEI